MVRKGPRVCGRFLKADPPGTLEGLVTPDVCAEEEGHDTSLEPSPHKGRWTGIEWETTLNAQGRRVRKILKAGQGEDEQTIGGVAGLAARVPVRRHGPHAATEEVAS